MLALYHVPEQIDKYSNIKMFSVEVSFGSVVYHFNIDYNHNYNNTGVEKKNDDLIFLQLP